MIDYVSMNSNLKFDARLWNNDKPMEREYLKPNEINKSLNKIS